MIVPSWMSSYGFSSEDLSGWGPRYYFTYYTTLGERHRCPVVFEVILLVLVLVCSLVANIAHIGAILRRKEIQTVTNSFIVNLACADVVFALGIPAIAAARSASSWNLGAATCKLLPYSQFVCGSVLLWTLTGISIDRYRCLASPEYKSGLTHRTAVRASVAAWVIALLIYLPVVIFFREQNVEFNSTITTTDPVTIIRNDITICTLVFPSSNKFNLSLAFTIPSVVITCFIPMGILVYNYRIIFKKLKEIELRLKEKIGNIELPPNKLRTSVQTIAGSFLPGLSLTSSIESGRHNPLVRLPSNGDVQRLVKHKRAVRIVYLNVFAVLIMWLPISVIMFLIYADGHREDTKFFLTNQYFIWSVIVALLNTIVNPILYGFLTENFRNHYPLCKWIQEYIWPVRNSVETVPSPALNTNPSSANVSCIFYCDLVI